MGNLRLLAHASYLLGRVLQHVSGEMLPEKDKTEQLHRTICALVNVLEVENQFGIVSVGVPRNFLNRLANLPPSSHYTGSYLDAPSFF